ncbi:MAG: type II toxin-antitoxin system VapC family toxin [Anaerolineales bacterium]|nr:type II toxin-antitoxin system VapC family toxin [Anaerolineales bacterium]
MKLIDTDIVIDHFHGHRQAFEYFTQTLAEGEILAVSVVSLTEILAGMRDGEQERTEKLFSLFVALEVDEQIARKAGEYLNQYRNLTRIELADALIAATALVMDADVVTRNIKHYPMGDVKVVVPYERGTK